LNPTIVSNTLSFDVPADTELLFGETDESSPFVEHEQMMPFVPFVRCPDVDAAIALAKKYEHGFKHTAVIHSRNVETITRMGREMDTTLFVQNGPSTAGLGSGGEGYLSFSIATPTGEGVTTPLTFTRQRRSTTAHTSRQVSRSRWPLWHPGPFVLPSVTEGSDRVAVAALLRHPAASAFDPPPHPRRTGSQR